jgi:hypothetical protein
MITITPSTIQILKNHTSSLLEARRKFETNLGTEIELEVKQI